MSRIKSKKDEVIHDKTFITTWCDGCKSVQLHEEIVKNFYEFGVSEATPGLVHICQVCESFKVTQ